MMRPFPTFVLTFHRFFSRLCVDHTLMSVAKTAKPIGMQTRTPKEPYARWGVHIGTIWRIRVRHFRAAIDHDCLSFRGSRLW